MPYLNMERLRIFITIVAAYFILMASLKEAFSYIDNTRDSRSEIENSKETFSSCKENSSRNSEEKPENDVRQIE